MKGRAGGEGSGATVRMNNISSRERLSQPASKQAALFPFSGRTSFRKRQGAVKKWFSLHFHEVH